MKLFLTLKYVLYILAILMFISCKKDSLQNKLLEEAQDSLHIGKPNVALIFLDSIQNPEDMDLDKYMQYIVAHTEAKCETKADITKDTLILKAQRYFNENEKSDYTLLANYYAAQLYDSNEDLPKALESYMYAIYNAEKSNNNLLAGKSYNNIGYIYYKQDILDSAIVNYQKALFYYNKVDNSEKRKLRTYTYIGRSYEEINKLDSASIYYNKALALSIATNNEQYKSSSLQNLGVLYFTMQKYDKAIEYFQSALNLAATDEEHRRKINIGMLMIYNKKQDPKSAKVYVEQIIADLPEISYKYTIKEVYSSLADYYRQIGDYKQASHYGVLEKAIKEQIEQEEISEALLAADKKFYITIKEKEVQELKSEVRFFFLIGLAALIIISFFVFLSWKQDKKNKEEIQRATEKYDSFRKQLFEMNNRFSKIESEIESILEED